MNYRSSNVTGYTHHGGDIVAHVDSSHGIQLTGGSAGGIVQAVGDDSNIDLSFLPKGTGRLVLGSTSTPLQFGNSTAAFGGIFRHTVQFTPPAVEASSWTNMSTITVTGLATNSALFPTFRTLDVQPSTLGSYVFTMGCSTAGELKIRANNPTGSTIGAQATSRFILTEIRFA